PNVFTGLSQHRATIIAAAARNNVPAGYSGSGFSRDGGLLPYPADGADPSPPAPPYFHPLPPGRQAGGLPGPLAVKYEMVLNRKTAKALGLAVPPSILLRADGVIE